MENLEIGEIYSIYSTGVYSTSINLSSWSTKKYVYTLFLNLDKTKTRIFIDDYKELNSEIIKININDFPLSSKGNDIAINGNNDIAITFTKYFVSKDRLEFVNNRDFEQYLTLFFENVKIKDITNLKYKINYKILMDDIVDYSSDIFSTNCSEPIELYDIFKNERLYRDQKILGVIGAVPTKHRNINRTAIIDGFLSILSDRRVRNGVTSEFVISLGNRSYITVSDIVVTTNTIDILLEIQQFIFRSSEKYYDRLNIFRSLFSEKIENKYKIDDELLNQLLEDTQLHYKLFIGDKIKRFIQQKQKVTEDYIKFSESIAKSINSVTEEIPKQLLTTIGIIITTFFLKGIDKNIHIWIVPLLALIYFGIYVFFKYKKGWFFESDNFEIQKEILDESYKELYTLDEDFVKKLRDEYLAPKLLKLKKMEHLTKKIVLCILLIILVWFLWA